LEAPGKIVDRGHSKTMDFHTDCIVRDYRTGYIELSAVANKPGYLVLSEMYYPGWIVTIDGRKGELLRGNYLFTVIPLDAGRHDIKLRFISWSFRVGALISLVTLSLALWAIVKGRRRDRD
jgi:uncharacterized membrane protein YfhO